MNPFSENRFLIVDESGYSLFSALSQVLDAGLLWQSDFISMLSGGIDSVRNIMILYLLMSVCRSCSFVLRSFLFLDDSLEESVQLGLTGCSRLSLDERELMISRDPLMVQPNLVD